MQRRKFLKNSTTLIASVPLLHINQFNIFNTTFLMDNDVVKIKIGTNASEEELDQSLNKYHISPDNIPSPFIALLLQQDDKKKLIDTGIGFSEKPVIVRGNSVFFKGRLHQLLQQENIKKEDITDVIITHFHPDHIGGIFSEDEKLNFPNAQFHMHEDEWNYWHSSQSDNQPAQFKYFIEKNITKLKGVNLHLIKGDFVDLLPGVTAIKADGHTPGQIAVIIHSEKEHLLYISDAFLHPLHIERLNWQTNYDLDHEKAKQSRVKLLELAHKDNMLVNAFHFDFPCLGRINRHDNNWIWNYGEK
jgi:glyoxylase-like metal-dependent hydrolase (beta-lactamase superfamily II)